MKFTTEIKLGRSQVQLSLNDGVMLLGSCFTAGIGKRMEDAGFKVCINPFGTLYNPASIANAVSRLDGSSQFTFEDCVEMGAGAGLVCSFEHHSSFARRTAGEFLENANEALENARCMWKECSAAVVTLGTAFIWSKDGKVVSNCLKRPAREFSRRMLSVEESSSILKDIALRHRDKRFIFTVSPIRHLGDGAHANTLSKATLHLGIEAMLGSREGLDYFPAYEILCDELRDYRFYATDLVHPSETAVDYIWEKFRMSCIPEQEQEDIDRNIRFSRHAAHRPMH